MPPEVRISPTPPAPTAPVTPAREPTPGDALPPPPPPRSTLPPLRKAPEITPRVSGVGSASVPRWRGELENIERTAEAKKAAKRAAMLAAETGRPIPEDALPEGEDDDEDTIEVTKAAPPWLASTVIHLIALLVLALIAGPGKSGIGRVMLELGFSQHKSSVELTEFVIDAAEEVSDDMVSNEVTDEVDVVDLFDTIEPSEATVAETDLGIGPQKLEMAKPMFQGRTGSMKKALLAIYGGSDDTVEAVDLGLKWLAKNQMSNGSWSMRGRYSNGAHSENRTAATAMAMLAFLGDGNTHFKGTYRENVEKGMKFLVSQQAKDGFMAKNAQNHQQMYAQAQATIALCELYAMTKDSWLRPKAQLAVDFAEYAQSQEGGWRYQPRFDADTSVTGWFVMGLKSAEAAGLEVDGSKLRRVSNYLDSVSDYDGAGYSYQKHDNPSPAMTAEGLLCRQYLDWQREHPPMRAGLQALLLDAPFDIRDADVYYWYYATQALHHYGGSLWRKWNDVMSVKLPQAQVKAGAEMGSWAPQRDHWGRDFGRLYTTCLSIYCLEVYYRHMPLYKDNAKGALP